MGVKNKEESKHRCAWKLWPNGIYVNINKVTKIRPLPFVFND